MTLRPIRRALLSVSDKTGLIDFAKGLARHGTMLISTGGTAKALRDAGLAVIDVSDVTQFPEMMDGRVKTLHPKIHGGLLALRDKADHAEAMRTHGIEGIDLLVSNLYPFEATVAKGAGFEETIENIDIGGPAMTRSAAKNHDWVTVVVDPEDYAAVLAEMDANKGATSLALRRKLAQIAFARTAAYDAAVSNWFARQLSKDGAGSRAASALPARCGKRCAMARIRISTRRSIQDESKRFGVATAEQLQGKELSYNNINDTDAAYELVAEFGGEQPACAIIKHANPCGVALGQQHGRGLQEGAGLRSGERLRRHPRVQPNARRRDGGGNRQALHRSDHRAGCRRRCAPHPGRQTKSAPSDRRRTARSERDGPDATRALRAASWCRRATTATSRAPISRSSPNASRPNRKSPTCCSPSRSAKHVKSNTIVYAKDGQTAGIGAGQMSRVDAARIAAIKAREAAGGRRLARAAHERLGRRVRCVLSLRRRIARGRRSRRHRRHPARRLDPRR